MTEAESSSTRGREGHRQSSRRSKMMSRSRSRSQDFEDLEDGTTTRSSGARSSKKKSRSRSSSQDFNDLEDGTARSSGHRSSTRKSRSRSRSKDFKDLEDEPSGGDDRRSSKRLSRAGSKKLSRSRSRSKDFDDLQEEPISGDGDGRRSSTSRKLSRSRSRSQDFKDLEDDKEQAKDGSKSKVNGTGVAVAGTAVAGLAVASNGQDIEATASSSPSPEEAPLLGDAKPLIKIGKNYRDDVKEEPLQENIFSLIFVAKAFSVAFTMSVTIAVIQIVMLFLALMDLVDVNNSDNPLRVPNDVSLPVRATGIVCLLLSVAQFWDFMEAIEKLQQGQPPRTANMPESATCFKFHLAYILQFCLGCIFEIAVFVFVVTSETVLDMFLNFAGLEFVTLIDDIMFALAKKGYFTAAVKSACDTVSDNMVPRIKGGRVVRRVILFLILVVLTAMYGVLAAKQEANEFDCEKIQVQFGDGFITLLPVFSGFYEIAREVGRRDRRPVYTDKERRAAFRYCVDGHNGVFSFASEGYWVFNYISEGTTGIDDMCDDYISRSPHTRGYDILEHPPSSWLVKRRRGDSLEYPVDYFNIRCVDCDESTCNGRCDENGKCVCNEGSFGLSCQFSDSVCEVTNYDHRNRKFDGANMNISSEFFLMKNSAGSPAFSFERPIYMFPYYLPNATQIFDNIEKVDVLMNLGRRYFMISIWNRGFRNSNLDRVDKVNSTAEFADYLESVHPYFDWIEKKYIHGQKGIPIFRPSFVSDPIDVGTASDNISPLGLSWTRVDTSPIGKDNVYDLYLSGAGVETVLLCAQCSESTPGGCNGRGSCGNSTCSCNPGFVGPTCEVDCFSTFLEPFCEDVPDCVKDLTCTAAELVSGSPTVDFYVYPTDPPTIAPTRNNDTPPPTPPPTIATPPPTIATPPPTIETSPPTISDFDADVDDDEEQPPDEDDTPADDDERPPPGEGEPPSNGGEGPPPGEEEPPFNDGEGPPPGEDPPFGDDDFGQPGDGEGPPPGEDPPFGDDGFGEPGDGGFGEPGDGGFGAPGDGGFEEPGDGGMGDDIFGEPGDGGFGEPGDGGMGDDGGFGEPGDGGFPDDGGFGAPGDGGMRDDGGFGEPGDGGFPDDGGFGAPGDGGMGNDGGFGEPGDGGFPDDGGFGAPGDGGFPDDGGFGAPGDGGFPDDGGFGGGGGFTDDGFTDDFGMGGF